MIDLLRQRLARHPILDARTEEQALKEILQEVALYALWRAGFFEVAAFQGGTCLRILHGLPRFSEDLDFILAEPDPDFAWSRYFDHLTVVDVAPFLSAAERHGLKLWSPRFFTDKAGKLARAMTSRLF